MVPEDEDRVRRNVDFLHVGAAFFEDIDMTVFGFCFEERLKTRFARGDARVRFAAERFLQDGSPGFRVCADVEEFCAVDLQVQGRFGWTVEDSVERDIPAQPM